MTNNKSTKLTTLLTMLVLVTSLFVGISIARYITNTSSQDEARVAKWGFSETAEPVTMDLFKNEYKLEDDTVVAKSSDDADIIAPGLNGVSKFKFITSSVSPEVMYEVKISVDDSDIAPEIKNHPGIQWKVDNGNWVTWDEMVSSLISLSGDPSGMKVYAPGELHDNFKSNVEHTIAWQWVMDSGYDVEDTTMGNLAADGTPITAKIVVTIIAKQTDVDSTGMLEGNGSVFNINDPQPLTFRADANYETFDTVEIDDVEVTNTDYYETAPGSIKIKLNKDYLATLSLGDHKITINTTDGKAIEAKFTVTDSITIVHNDIIPEGGVYYSGINFDLVRDNGYPDYYDGAIGEYADATIYTAGQKFPKPQVGDAYIYEDYEYRYGMRHEGSLEMDYGLLYKTGENEWMVTVRNKQKTIYGNILTEINNVPVKNMDYTFAYSNLTTSPIIPETVESLDGTYWFSSLNIAPNIPKNVIYMNGTYAYCSIDNTIVIPSNVKHINNILESATDSPMLELNSEVLTYNNALAYSNVINITGTCSNKLKSELVETSQYDFTDITFENGTYYTKVTSNKIGNYYSAEKIYKNGEFPETVSSGDVYIYNDYEYRYNKTPDASYNTVWKDADINGWSVRYIGTSGIPYEILSSINGVDVVSMVNTFAYTYSGGISGNIPKIPNTVTNINGAFQEAIGNNTVIVPSSVTSMDFAFYLNPSFTNLIINGSPTSYKDALKYTSVTEIGGSCPEEIKVAILETQEDWPY